MDEEHPFRILVHETEAWADTEAGALCAAATLIEDYTLVGGSSRLLRQTIIITRNRIYDSRLTQAARAGRRTL